MEVSRGSGVLQPAQVGLTDSNRFSWDADADAAPAYIKTILALILELAHSDGTY